MGFGAVFDSRFGIFGKRFDKMNPGGMPDSNPFCPSHEERTMQHSPHAVLIPFAPGHLPSVVSNLAENRRLYRKTGSALGGMPPSNLIGGGVLPYGTFVLS